MLLSSLHWKLVIVCYPQRLLDSASGGPFILVFDSLAGKSPHVLHYVKEYLQSELEEKLGMSAGEIQGGYFKGPLQENHCDCGVYILEYVERFFVDLCTSKGDFIEPPLEDLRTNYRDWFTAGQIEAKRARIFELLTFHRGQYLQSTNVKEQASDIVIGEESSLDHE
jgi:Ulp1 family protease